MVTERDSTTHAPADPPRLLVPEREARRILGGLCAKTMFNLRRSGVLPFLKIGTRTMYRMSDLVAFADGKAVRS